MKLVDLTHLYIFGYFMFNVSQHKPAYSIIVHHQRSLQFLNKSLRFFIQHMQETWN